MDLNKDFTSKDLILQPDYEGEVKAVLTYSNHNKGNRDSVLYVHGFIDYFFHTHVAEVFNEHGFDFYALDLRKHGRALLPHQHPNYCRNITEYFEEITMAIEEIHHNSTGIYLLGHSTGGLTTSLYMNEGPKKDLVKGLILNSPFLDVNLPKWQKTLTVKVARVVAQFSDYAKVNGAISPAYAQSVHKDHHGEWDFNKDWKPIKGFPAFFKWFVAIDDAQQKLTSSNIKVPVLILHSSGSYRTNKFSDKALSNDIVLNIEDIKRVGKSLGKDITFECIHEAQHDVFLSKESSRDESFNKMFAWLSTKYK